MAGIDRAQEANAFRPAQFAQHDPVGPKAKRGLKQFVRGDLGFAQFALHRDEADAIFTGQFQLGRIFDQNHALMLRNLAEHGVQKGGLARAGAARDQDCAPLADRLAQEGDRLLLRVGHGALRRRAQRPAIIGVERQVEPAVAADRHRPVAARGRRAAELHARSIRQGRAQKRVFAVDPLMADARDLFGEALDQPIVDLGNAMALHPRLRAVLNPHLARPVDEDFGDGVAVQPFAKRGEIGVEIDAALTDHGGGISVLGLALERVDLGAHGRVARVS